MTTGAVGPGTLLSGRYHLEDLLSDTDGARFWRATDTVLARNVAIHAVPSDDERAARLMEAARLSATVADPRLLRVLDADEQDGVTWVVNEWGEGTSLDLMLARGTLPPARAAWLTREVAETIAHGHALGVSHGRLRPETVLVTDAGTVKIIGYVVDASLCPERPSDPLYGVLDDREADVIDLAGILYAALTGRWPGVAPSAVPPAPREARRPLRPRQVRAGVPRTLDAICDRVLHQEASQHAMPIETAQEVAAALADYVGDPTHAAPLDAAGMHSEVPDRRPVDPDATQLTPTADASDPEATQLTPTADAPDPDATRLAPALGEVQQHDGRHDRPARPAAALDPEATQLSAAVRSPDPEDVAIRREPLEGPDSLDAFAAPVQEAPPPPPFEEVPERPLFASTERRVPAAARTADAWAWSEGHRQDRDDSGRDTGTGTSTSGFWAVGDEGGGPAVHTGREGRGWFRMAVVVGLLIVLVVGGLVALQQLRSSGGGSAVEEGGSDSTPATKTTGQVLKAVGVKDFDPQGDPSTENPETTRNAIDGDPATTWTTMTYRGNPALGGLKDGVGLVVDLGRDREVGSVEVRFVGSPTSFSVYAAPSGVSAYPDSLDQLDRVGSRQGAGTRARVTLDPAPTTRYVLVWLTRLPAADGGYRGEISGITVRS